MFDNKINNICDKIGICGGCIDRNLTYDEQLKNKQDMVKNLIDEAREKIEVQYDIKLNDYIFEDIITSPNIFKYRNKMEFSFGDDKKDGPLTLGMHQKKSFYNVVDAVNCDLISDDMKSILSITLDFFKNKNIKYFHKRTHIGYLRHLVLRKSFYENNIMINLVTTTQIDQNYEKELLSEYVDILIKNQNKYNYNIKSIIKTTNNSLSDAVKVDSMDILFGDEYIVEKLFDYKFKISPFSFFQTNTLGAEKLYNKVKSYLIDNETNDKFDLVYDLYCGTGTITQVVSDVCKKVIGVEIVEEAVDKAKENADYNNISNVQFICADVNEYVKTNKTDLNIDNKNLAIILDPPRDGVNKNALSTVLQFGAKKIVYISCKIQSLARDYEYFNNYGYDLIKVCPVDMFPWTKNIETVAMFIKNI